MRTLVFKFTYVFLPVIALLSTMSTAHATLRGDWESAGWPGPRTPVKYDYKYSCQAELSDQVVRSGRYLYAYQAFDISPGQNSWKSEDESGWKWIETLNHDEIPLASKPAGAFSTQSVATVLNVYRGDGANAELDAVVMDVTLRYQVGKYWIPQSTTIEFQRKDTRLMGQAKIALQNVNPKAGAAAPYLELKVICDKIK